MFTITLSIAQARLTAYLDAEAKVLGGQSYRIGERTLTRANLTEIRAGIDYWSAKIDTIEASGGMPRRGPVARGITIG